MRCWLAACVLAALPVLVQAGTENTAPGVDEPAGVVDQSEGAVAEAVDDGIPADQAYPADDPDAGEDAGQLPPVAAHCRVQMVGDPRWFDRAQGYFSQQACTPATWFDRFFGGERTGDVASALVRVLPSLQYSDRDFTDAGVRFKARLNLPNLRDRLNLVINDDADEQAGLLQGETQRPQVANAAASETTAALRYLVKLAGRSGANVDVGLRGQAKFFSRARYYKAWALSDVLDSRFTQFVFFLDGDGFGESSRFEVERLLTEDTMFRWSSQLTASEALRGWELRDGVHLLHQIDRDRALTGGLSITLDSEPVWRTNAYGASVRYRQRAFRPWFFYEIEPFVDAVRSNGFRLNPGIALRVELWLGDDSGGRRRDAPQESAANPVAPAEAPLMPGDQPAAVPAGVEPLTSPDGGPAVETSTSQ